MKGHSLPETGSGGVNCLILQVALRPQTGIWSLMRELLLWQNQQVGLLAVGGYLGDREWIDSYGRQLGGLGVPFVFQEISNVWRWGIERHLRQIFRSPVNRWVAALVEKYRPRRVVVHFHDAWLSGGFLPVRLAGEWSPLIIATFNGISSHELFRSSSIKRALHRFLAQRLVKHHCKLISVDRCNLTYAQEFFGLRPAAFTVIPNTVRDLGLQGCPSLSGRKEFVVGHVGSVSDSKGWRVLAEAVLRLTAERLPVRLVVAGEGPESPELQSLCSRHPGVIRALGSVPHAGKEVVPTLDALGLISRWEGQPLCILEALSCGVPVIATNVGGIPETIADGQSGFIVQRDAAETADRLASLVRQPALHAAMSKCARETFLNRYQIDKVGGQYRELCG
jgi:glycosyltransferase involved in cell wall biosynthesis